MVEPRLPRTADARVPCPLCGGLIHPIAGRCKHCKQDLTELRAYSNGHARVAVVPPRPRPPTGDVAPRASIWRYWPIAVIVLAVVVMLGAVALLVWPSDPPAAAAKPSPGLPAASADRMPTEPSDPWAGPSVPPRSAHHAAPVPVRPTPQPGSDSDDDTQLLDPNDLSKIGPLAVPSGGSFMFAMATHLCTRLQACGTANDFITTYCEGMTTLQQQAPAPAPTCDQGKRCLDAIDKMSCTAKADDATALFQLMNQMPDCFQAMTRC
ncbi:MAG TPA: hypothetical protein VGF94_01815 [Kofleriaceae bacterium]|jgi:hypothetical protein